MHPGVIFFKLAVYLLQVAIINTPKRLKTFLLIMSGFVLVTTVISLLKYNGRIYLPGLIIVDERIADPVTGDVPTEQTISVRWALLIMGLQVSISLLLQIFDAGLWACQRFDLLNIVDVSIAILRASLIAAVIGLGADLVALAVVMLVTTLLSGLLKAWLLSGEGVTLRLSRRWWRLVSMRELVEYGMWNCAASITHLRSLS